WAVTVRPPLRTHAPLPWRRRTPSASFSGGAGEDIVHSGLQAPGGRLNGQVAQVVGREHRPALPPDKSGKGIPGGGAVGVDSSSIVAGPAAPSSLVPSAAPSPLDAPPSGVELPLWERLP